MSSDISDLYKQLFAGNQLSILLGDKRAYESMRTALAKQHQHTKLLLELTNDSLCASFDASQGIGTFYLGTARKARTRAAFTILSVKELGEPDAQV